MLKVMLKHRPEISPLESNEAVIEGEYVEWEPFCNKIIFNRCMNPKVGAGMIGDDNNTEYLIVSFFLSSLFPSHLSIQPYYNSRD